MILVASNNPFVADFDANTHLYPPVMFGFELGDLLAGYTKGHSRNRNAASFRDWCVTYLAGKTRRSSDTAARVVDKALTFCLFTLLCDIHCIGH
ncbi:hypothetical protein KPSB59_3300038 [Klebsiella quasipneumoniae subsp. quasipneumoniae]|nr:hypothetical protein KPSB59_3300038 [Klebsiella quasipneumoniae subsp. quasipneumoniae]